MTPNGSRLKKDKLEEWDYISFYEFMNNSFKNKMPLLYSNLLQVLTGDLNMKSPNQFVVEEEEEDDPQQPKYQRTTHRQNKEYFDDDLQKVKNLVT